MPQRLFKILIILAISAVLVGLPAFWLTYASGRELEADFLAVGQGDAILIKTPNGQNVLIDGGPDQQIMGQLSKNLPWWDRKIDLMILTHPHDDHVTGLIRVVKNYKVAKVIYSGVAHSSPNFLAWLELIKEKKIPLLLMDHRQTVDLGVGTELELLYPAARIAGRRMDNLNNSSIVARLARGKTSMLFMGDAEKEVEAELLSSGSIQSADLLKLGHHGSDTSSSEEFLRAVDPDIAIIEVGRDNSFGHPSRRVLKRLDRLGAEIKRTDENGTIKAVSDGSTIIIE